MIVFNHVNMLESFQEQMGPNWNIFLYDGTPPETVAEIPFDVSIDNNILSNSIGCIRAVSSILSTPYSLDFAVSSKLYGNNLPGYEKSEPTVESTPIYRTGFLASSSNIPDYDMEKKLDLLSGRTELSFTASDTFIDLVLTQVTDVDYITVMAGASTEYSVYRVLEGVETLMFAATGPSIRVPHELSTETLCDTIRIRFVDGSCTLSSVAVYSLDEPSANTKTPTWAIILPVTFNTALLPANNSRPFFVSSAGGPETTADMRLNKGSVSAQDSLSMLFFRVRPTVMEV